MFPLYPKSKDIERLMDNFVKMDNIFGIAMRTTPNVAEQLSKYKAIHRLRELDAIDIARRKRGRPRSIIYFPPSVHIMKKLDGNGRNVFYLGFK